MQGKTIAFLLAAALSQGLCAGEIYRCTAANGDVMFTNIACPAKSQVQHVASYVPEQYSPVQAQELAAEAAAISARQAQESAERAQAAAYQAAQASYRQPEYETETGNDNYSPGWIAYPVFVQHHSRHDGHHPHGGHDGHGGGKPNAPMQPIRTALPAPAGGIVRLR
jgi:hypothetical protein